MDVFRIEKKKFIPAILDGIPGEKSDFRWNTKGHPIIYTSISRSLALNEKTANMSKPFHGLNPSYVIAVITLPDLEYRCILPKELPSGWDEIGAYHFRTQEIGDNFTDSDELALFVPSTIVKGEYNVLINPNKTKDFDIKVSIEEINTRLIDTR